MSMRITTKTIAPPKEWTKILGVLAWAYSFWATLLYEMIKVKFTDEIPTLGVGGGTLYVNLSYFTDEKFTDSNRIFMVAHELSHEMFFHPQMAEEYRLSGFDGEPFDPKRWNIAADYVINGGLVALGVGEYHDDWLLRKDIGWEDNVVDVYRRLRPKPPPPGQGDGEGEGQGAGQNSPPQGGGGGGPSRVEGDGPSGSPNAGTEDDSESETPAPQQYDILDKDGNVVGETPAGAHSQDTHVRPTGDVGENPATEADWKTAVAAAQATAKSIGQGSAALDRFVEAYIETKRDWKKELRDYIVVSRGRETYDFKRSHKRKMHERGLFVPTKLSYKMGPVAFIHDVSGSVSHAEHMVCKSAGVEILTDCKPKSVRVLCCESLVCDDQEYETVEEYIDWQPTGTGGTDMEAAFRYLVKEQFIPEVCIVLTDGWTGFNEPPPFPVVWLSTDKDVGEFPYGHAIKLELEG